MISVKMRAVKDGSHHSGAERIVPSDELEGVAVSLIRRAQFHKNGIPDEIHIKTKIIKEKLLFIRPLDVMSISAKDVDEGVKTALMVMVDSGISRECANLAVEYLRRGAAPGGENMRGAIIMNAYDGERLEEDPQKGVRVSTVDMEGTLKDEISKNLKNYGIESQRPVEAVTIASKRLYHESVILELCWSDDPDYTTGYVASKKHGYVRIENLKRKGDRLGGRVIFVKENADLKSLCEFLKNKPAMICGNCKIFPPKTSWM